MLTPKDVIEKYPHNAYVYICYLNDVPVYVGKGRGKRYLHCTSGKSSNSRLNEAFFKYGADALDIRIIFYNLYDDVALAFERDLIKSLTYQDFDIFNVDKKPFHNMFIQGVHKAPNPSYLPEWVTENIDDFEIDLGLERPYASQALKT